MKKLKRVSTLLFAVMMMAVMSLSVYAADSSKDYGDSYDGKIVIHKYDTSDYENYVPGDGDGTELASTDKIGEDGSGSDVTVNDLTELANIPFTIEQVRIMTTAEAEALYGAGTVVDPTNPDHYVLVTGTAVDGTIEYVTDANGVITFSGLPQGIYRITEVTNSTSTSIVDSFLISLPMIDPTDSTGSTTMKEVHVYPKNTTFTAPVVEKEVTNLTVNDNTYDGSVIEWTIASEVPGTISGAATVEKYTLTDTYGSYLSFLGDLKVYYMDASTPVDLALTTDYTFVVDDIAKTFTIELTQAGRAKLAAAIASGSIDGDTTRDYLLYVKYKTQVTISDDEWLALVADANKENITNTIVLDFTNDSGTSYQSEDEDIPDLYQIKILKYDGANTATYLAGAKFKIYTALNPDGTPDTSTVVKDKDSGSEIEVETGADGAAYINGLPAGTYYIVETAAPTGYTLDSTPIEVIVSDTTVAYTTVEQKVANYNNFTLPKTGGTGTMLFTIGGVVLIAAAGFVYFVSRKKEVRQK